MSFKLFHWRTRVKTATPEVAGSSVETLTSHVSDINAHPDYLKKGAAVPTGQEEVALSKHEKSPVAHSKNYARRGELLKTLEQYHAARSTDIVDNQNNFDAELPQRHIVTAYILNMALEEALDDIFIEGKLVIGPVGDGSQLIYVDDKSNIVVSTKSIGGSKQFVYLNNGVLTASTETLGSNTRPIYLSSGVIKYATTSVGAVNQPIYMNGGNITASNANIGSVSQPVYMDAGVIKPCTASFQIPVKGCFTTIYEVTDVTALLGYGTWEVLHVIGNNEAKIWKRTA